GGTFPSAINKPGAIAGFYAKDNSLNGFVRAADGTITTFDAKGSLQTLPYGINNRGTITGIWQHDLLSRGFLRSANGATRRFVAPNSSQTVSISINNGGVITGYFTDSGGNDHGFLRTHQGPK